jgi:hypothetical protein
MRRGKKNDWTGEERIARLCANFRGCEGEPRSAEPTRSIIGAFYEVYNTLGFGLRNASSTQISSLEIRMANE